ncbi:MAG: fatty acid desaturase [Planctomycetota bacterium]
MNPLPTKPRGTLRWDSAIMLVTMHLMCLAAPWTFSWSGLAWCFLLIWVGSGLGITLGYHRLLTHHSFKTNRPMHLLLTMIGCINFQHGPVEWVGTHRMHHRHTDQHDDPHSPRHGFMWSHMRWAFFKTHPDPSSYARDLTRDRAIRLIDRNFWCFPIGVMVALYFLGEWTQKGLGWSWVVYGGALRTIFVFHSIWFVNSAAHTWGYRNFESKDDSRNCWWVALLSFGEGWHNNHHAQPRCAAHGRRWWEFDPTWITIRLLQRLGLVWAVVRPKALDEERAYLG